MTCTIWTTQTTSILDFILPLIPLHASTFEFTAWVIGFAFFYITVHMLADWKINSAFSGTVAAAIITSTLMFFVVFHLFPNESTSVRITYGMAAAMTCIVLVSVPMLLNMVTWCLAEVAVFLYRRFIRLGTSLHDGMSGTVHPVEKS